MKSFLPALLAAVLASGLTLILAPQLRPALDGPAAEVSALPSGQNAASPVDAPATDVGAQITANAALARVQELEMTVSSLRAEIEQRHSRQSVASSEDGASGSQPLAGQLIDGEARNLILDVVAQKEEDDRKARQEERDQRNAERLLERADEIAAELGLNRTDRDALHSVMLEESTRRSNAFEAMREGGFGDRDTMRAEMEAIGEWKDTELITRFGDDLADKIDDLDGGGNPFGRGGNRGGNRGGGGNGGGGRGGA